MFASTSVWLYVENTTESPQTEITLRLIERFEYIQTVKHLCQLIFGTVAIVIERRPTPYIVMYITVDLSVQCL